MNPLQIAAAYDTISESGCFADAGDFQKFQMSDLVRASVEDVCPSPYGYAVFLSAGSKTFVVYVDRSRGAALQSALDGLSSERPLTHEFVMQMLDGLDCRIARAVIYHVEDGTFFTRLTVEMSNEIGEKIVEVDGRPSDTFALAMRAGAPIFIESSVLGTLPDMSGALKKLRGES